MTTDQMLQAASIVVPVICAVVLDGIHTRTQLALVKQRQKWQEDRQDELERRQARHERAGYHARPRP